MKKKIPSRWNFVFSTIICMHSSKILTGRGLFQKTIVNGQPKKAHPPLRRQRHRHRHPSTRRRLHHHPSSSLLSRIPSGRRLPAIDDDDALARPSSISSSSSSPRPSPPPDFRPWTLVDPFHDVLVVIFDDVNDGKSHRNPGRHLGTLQAEQRLRR